MYFKASEVNFLNYDVFLSLKVVLILTNSAYPDEMQHPAFYLGLYCLPKYPFRGLLTLCRPETPKPVHVLWQTVKNHLKCCIIQHFIRAALFVKTNLIFKERNEPWHKISNNVLWATRKASDQPGHTHSLIRAFASPLNILWVLSYWMNIIRVSKLKRRLHRLVWVYACQNATLLEISSQLKYIFFKL